MSLDWIHVCPICRSSKDNCPGHNLKKPMPPSRMLIYVAGPYTAETFGSEQKNVDQAMDVALTILKKGHFPVVPHLFHYLDHRNAYTCGSRLPYDLWLAMGDELLKKCDGFYFIGPSNGSLRELDRARELDLVLFSSLDEVPEIGIQSEQS